MTAISTDEAIDVLESLEYCVRCEVRNPDEIELIRDHLLSLRARCEALEDALTLAGNILANEKIDATIIEGGIVVETLHQQMARLLGGHPAARTTTEEGK